MRIAFTSPYSIRQATGINEMIASLAEELSRMNYKAWLLCPDGQGRPYYDVSGATKVAEIGVSHWPMLKDLVLAYATFWRLLGIRREVDVLHAHQPHLQTIGAILAARIIGAPALTTLHLLVPRPANRVRRVFLEFLERLCISLADEVAYVSEATRREFGRLRGRIVPNGINTDRFRPNARKRNEVRSRYGIREDECLVLFLSRWARNKGVGNALDAFASIRDTSGPRVKLVVAGYALPHEATYVTERIKELNLSDNAITVGPVNDTVPWFQSSDVFLLPSYQEGLPLALLEAMSTELACIVTPVGGIEDVVSDGANGLVVPVGDSLALAGAMRTCIEDPSLRSHLGKEARRTIEKRFGVQRMVESYTHIFEDLVRSP